MSEEKSSPIGIIVVVAVIAVVAAFFVGKSGGGNGDQTAGNQQEPTNGSDTNQTTPPPSPQKKANGSDMNKTAPPPEPPKPKYDFAEGLVAYYPFNGNAKDESGNGHDGEVKGATLAKDRHGEDEKTYSFDGQDDFIEVSHTDALDLGNGAGKEWTVAIWFKSDIKARGWLLRKGGSGGSYTQDYGVLASTTGGFNWGTGKSAFNGGSDVTDWMHISHEVSSDEWHHVVATYKQGASNEGFKIFYIDGQQTGKAASGNWKNSAKNDSMRIGAGRIPPHWQGLIDDVRIYNRALSEEQIKALYDLEKSKE